MVGVNSASNASPILHAIHHQQAVRVALSPNKDEVAREIPALARLEYHQRAIEPTAELIDVVQMRVPDTGGRDQMFITMMRSVVGSPGASTTKAAANCSLSSSMVESVLTVLAA